MVLGALATIGAPILAMATGLGLNTLGIGAVTAGGLALGAGAGVGLGGLGSAGAAANPHIGNGIHNAVMDAYNNAAAGSFNAINGLNLPGVPHFGP